MSEIPPGTEEGFAGPWYCPGCPLTFSGSDAVARHGKYAFGWTGDRCEPGNAPDAALCPRCGVPADAATSQQASWGEVAAEIAGQLDILPGAVMTDEEATEFRERFAAAMDARWKPHLLPQRKPLTQDEVYQLLRECVTVVKPGEALVVRMAGLTPMQHQEYQRAATDWHEHGNLPFQVFIFAGDELGVVQAEATHLCPVEGEFLTPCCGKTPDELPRMDRLALDADLVTCGLPHHLVKDGDRA